MSGKMTAVEGLLGGMSDSDWAGVLSELSSGIHEVDRQAVRIWFAFFPVKLHRALSEAADPAELARKLILKGKFRLSEQVDSSAEFLFGHRHWPEVKREVAGYAASGAGGGSIAAAIREVAAKVAGKVKVEASLLTGIVAVAFGTLQQVGLEKLSEPAQPGSYGKSWRRTADQVVAERKRDDKPGLFGFLKSVDREFSVNFREQEAGCSFKVVNTQDVTTAAAADQRDWHEKDMRCRVKEGPIPVECRTAACGTCWVGVLSPTEKISPPNDRETNRWVYFGYEGFNGEADSLVRLACQIKAYGNVTIVIPPWNGMIGKLDEKASTQKA